MSGIYLSGNRLIQRVRDGEEELGYIELEPNSESCVLWLKDTFGVASTAGAYIRADEYPSLEAKKFFNRSLRSPQGNAAVRSTFGLLPRPARQRRI